MLIYRSIETNILTQDFGENKACVKTDISGRMVYPVKVTGKVKGVDVCPVGFKNFYRDVLNMLGHNGKDWKTYYRENLYFPVVAESKFWARTEVDSSGGVGIDVFSLNPVAIKEEDLPQEMGELAKREWRENGGKIRVKFRFWHLQDVNLEDKPKVEIGKHADGSPQLAPEVKTGDLIGWCDNTGSSSGNHSHEGEKFTTKNSMTLDSNNGYYGACNFKKLYKKDTFILDMLGKKLQLTPSQKISRLILNVKEKKTILILKNLSSFLFASGE